MGCELLLSLIQLSLRSWRNNFGGQSSRFVLTPVRLPYLFLSLVLSDGVADLQLSLRFLWPASSKLLPTKIFTVFQITLAFSSPHSVLNTVIFGGEGFGALCYYDISLSFGQNLWAPDPKVGAERVVHFSQKDIPVWWARQHVNQLPLVFSACLSLHRTSVL